MQLAIRPAVVPRPMLFFVAAALLAVALAGVLFVARVATPRRRRSAQPATARS